jgi:hypothetical protein
MAEPQGNKLLETKALEWLRKRRPDLTYELMPEFAVVDIKVADHTGDTIGFIEVKQRFFNSNTHTETVFKKAKLRNGWDLLKKIRARNYYKTMPKYYYMAVWTDKVGVKEFNPDELQNPELFFGDPIQISAKNDGPDKAPYHFLIPVSDFVTVYTGDFAND